MSISKSLKMFVTSAEQQLKMAALLGSRLKVFWLEPQSLSGG